MAGIRVRRDQTPLTTKLTETDKLMTARQQHKLIFIDFFASEMMMIISFISTSSLLYHHHTIIHICIIYASCTSKMCRVRLCTTVTVSLTS